MAKSSVKVPLDPNDCILVQFVNEDDSLAVAYRSFLKVSVTDSELQEIIAKEVVTQLKWPNRKFNTAKDLENCEWTLHPVIITHQGSK